MPGDNFHGYISLCTLKKRLKLNRNIDLGEVFGKIYYLK